MTASVMQQFDVLAQIIASGTVSSSARRLDLSPDMVTETLRQLERRLGFPVVTLTADRAELTEAGRKLVDALGRWDFTGDAPLEALIMAGTEPEAEAGGRPMAIAPSAATPTTVTEPSPSRPASARSLVASKAPSSNGGAPKTPTHKTPVQISDSPEETPVPSARAQDIAAPSAVAADAGERPERQTQTQTQTIVLAAHPAIFAHFQEALVAFEEASPDIAITLRLDALDARTLAPLFAHRDVDIAYFYALEEPDGFASRYAWSERLSLFAGKDHPLARQNAVLADELTEQPCVAFAPGNIQRALGEAALARSGIRLGPAQLETDNLYDLMKAVRAGHGLFAAFGPIARDFGKMQGIHRLPYAQSLPQVEVRQAVRPDRATDPAVLALSEFLFR